MQDTIRSAEKFISRFPFLAGLRSRLLLLAFLALVPVLGLTLYTYTELHRLVAADEQREALRLVRIAAVDQDEAIKDTRQLLFALAQLPEVHGADSGTCSTFFARLLSQSPQYALLGVATPDGDILCSAPRATDSASMTERDYFRRILETQVFVIGDYQSDPVSGRATLELGYPVFATDANVEAVVFASLDLAWLNQLAAEAQLPEGSTLTVTDQNGAILVRYPDPEAWVGRSVPNEPIVKAILAQQGEGTVQEVGLDGVSRLFAFTPLSIAPGGGGVYVSVGIPTTVAFEGVDRVLLNSLVGLGIVAALALAAVWLGGDWLIMRGVNELVGAAERVSAGDIDVLTGLLDDKSELGRLAHAIDEMAESLGRRMAERDRAEESLRQADTLLQVASVIGSTLELDEVLVRILDELRRVVDYDSASVQLLQDDALHIIAGQGFADGDQVTNIVFPRSDEFPNWKVVEAERPINLVDGSERYAVFRQPPHDHVRGWLGVPLHVHERIIGVITLDRKEPGGYTEREVRMATAFADLAAVAVENARLYLQAEQLAVIRERERLSRELHDSVTQSLYSLTLLAEAGRQFMQAGDLERIEGYLERLGEIGQQALKEMRLLVYELRPLVLKREGLVGALQQRLDAVEKRAGVDVRLFVKGEAEVPMSMEEGLYRIAQEALNNILKHAEATSVIVSICAESESVTLEITDDGAGFDSDAPIDRGGMGLVSMRERAEKLGGAFSVSSVPGEGTRVVVNVEVRCD